jgi:hypothetical protein
MTDRPNIILDRVPDLETNGTVTSVSGLSPLFTVTNPTTQAVFSAISQNQNLFYAGPTSGSAAAPTFRALVIGDIPASGTPDNTTFLRGDGTWSVPAGGVSSVSGTSNRITSTGGTTPVIDISAAYVGQSSITTVGTLTSGATGAGFTISLGTSTLNGDLPFANLTQGSARSVLGVTGNATADFASIQGSTDQVLRVDGAGTGLSFGSIDLSKSATVGSSVLPVANGGTGAANLNGFWITSGTSTLTSDVTIDKAGFNTLYLNGSSLLGPTGATITASTRSDIRGISGGNIVRWASDGNVVRGAFQNDGIFYIGASAITSATEVFQIGTTTTGTHSFARFANKSAASSTTSGKIVFENDGAGIASIVRGSSAYTSLGGNNSFNFGTEGSAPITLFTNNNARYTITGTGLHTWTNNMNSGTNTDFTFTQNARTAGVPTMFTITGGAHTSLTAGSSITELNVNLARTVQWASNTSVTAYRGLYVQAPSALAFASATGTITTASTVSISGAPAVGTNAAITNPLALYVESGNSSFVTGVIIGGATITNASALLDLQSTTKTIILPRMTKTQRDAITTKVAGMAVYQTDNTPGLRVYNGTNWMKYTEATD